MSYGTPLFGQRTEMRGHQPDDHIMDVVSIICAFGIPALSSAGLGLWRRRCRSAYWLDDSGQKRGDRTPPIGGMNQNVFLVSVEQIMARKLA